MSKKGETNIGNNMLTNGEEIPLNISKVTWKDIVVNGTKVKATNRETYGIPVTETKTTTGAKNNEEITFTNLKSPV